MIPGFTASELLPSPQDPRSAHGHNRWAKAYYAPGHVGVHSQERFMPGRDGGGGPDAAISDAACYCPCCIYHACGFLGLSTCMTCC